MPTMNAADEDGRRLGNWLHTQRRRLRSGRLDPERAMWLDLNLPGWDDPAADAWYANAESCALHVADGGRFPAGGADDAAERRLATWLRGQRVIARRGRMADERRRWLDEAIPGWDRPHETDWFTLATSLVAFEASTGRMPATSADAAPAERRLGTWLSRQRSRHAAGRLPERHVVWLDQRLPSWRTRATDQWSCRLEATIAFAFANGRLPARSAEADGTERGLA
ncbi:MAG: helicase associated domain-containing protein, partial [Agromyces sp.]